METKDSSSGEKSQSSLTPDFISHGNEMFVAMADSKTEVSAIVKDFLSEIYSQDKEIGEYTLIDFVFRCGGFKCSIIKKMTKYGYADLVEYVTKTGQCGDYGMHPLMGKKSKVNANKLSDFISELIIQSDDTSVAYDDYLVPNLAEFLRHAAQTGHNNLRYTATFCAMRLTSALLNIETVNQKLRDRYTEDLQDALDSRQASRVILMKEKASKKKDFYEKRLLKIQKIINYLLKKNFLNAYRDMWQPVQLLSIQELVVFIHNAPTYLTKMGKYVIQAMFDPAVIVRISALKAISTGLDAIDTDDDSEYEAFFEAAVNSLKLRILDVNEQVAVLAIQLMGKICERFRSAGLSPEDKRGVANMVYANRSKVAQEAGIVMRYRQRGLKSSDFILWLARFHARNVRDFPTLFRPGTEAMLLSALPENCSELTDWEAMMAAAVKPGPDSHALAVIIAAAVARTVVVADPKDSDELVVNKELRKMTKVFLKPLFTLMATCEDLETIAVYLQIIRHMDVSTLCTAENKAESAKLIRQVSRVALVNCNHLVLARPCAAALAPLVLAGNDDAKDAVGVMYNFGITRLEENMGSSTESSLEDVEASLCLLAAFGQVEPPPKTVEQRLLEILTEVADDAALSPSKWSSNAHAHAIKALFYDYTWTLMINESSSILKEVTTKKADYLLTVILGYIEAKQEFGEATNTVISAALDLRYTLDSDGYLDSLSELFLKVSKYLEINVVAQKNDAEAQMEFRPMIVAFFKLLIKGYIDPELSAVFYKNYALMSGIIQQTIIDLHSFFCDSLPHHGSLCKVLLAGLKRTYVDQYPTGSDCDLELSVRVTELANTSALVCSWLMPDKKVTKKDYEKKSEEIANIMTEIITSCIASPQTMAPFCEVLAPFSDKLTDGHKKKMLKLVMKGFAGMASPAVKKLVSRLRMKNTELEKLGKLTAKDTEEIPPSPIEHQRLDGSHYAPLQLRSSRIPSSENKPALSLVAEDCDHRADNSGSEGSPKIQLSESKSSNMSDPVLSPAESSDVTLEKRPSSGEDSDLEPPHRGKPLGHSTLIKKQPTGKSVGKPNPRASSSLPESMPGSSSSKAQAVTLKNLPRLIKSRPRKLNFVPLPIKTTGAREVGHNKINIYSPLQENVDSIHEYPACSLAKNNSPVMVVAAEDCTGTPDVCGTENSLASGKPAEISSRGESCNDSLRCDSVLDQSAGSARVAASKASSHRSSDIINRSADMSVSYENAPIQKHSLASRSPSQALNMLTVVHGGWSVSANAGSFDKNSAKSSSVPQAKEWSDKESDSSQESSVRDNTQLPGVNSAIEEHEDIPSTQQGSGSSKEVLRNKQNAAGNLLASEDCEDELQIRSSKLCLGKSPDSLKLFESAAAKADECRSDDYDSEDFIPSSLLCSMSPDKKSPLKNTSNQVALISEDESDYEVNVQETSRNSSDDNVLASSLKKVVLSSSPKIEGKGDMPADYESDNRADIQQTSRNSSFTKKLASSPEDIVASSPELCGMADIVAEVRSSSEEDLPRKQGEQAIGNSNNANRFADSPERAIITFSPEFAAMGGMLAESDSDGEDKVVSNRPFSVSESDCDLDSSESEVPDSGQKALECLAGPSQETFRGLTCSLYRDCKESQDKASSKSEDQVAFDSENQAMPEIEPSSCDMGNLPELMMDLIKGNDSQKSDTSVAPSLVATPQGSSMDEIKCNRSEKSLLLVAPMSTISPSDLLMSDESDESVKSRVSAAPSSVMSPPNSLMNDSHSDESVKSNISAAPSSVVSPSNSLMNDNDSDESVKSQVSAAPSLVMSPPYSLMDDKESDKSVKSQVSVVPSSVMSSPNSLMNDSDSDESVKSNVSAAPSSVVSPSNSLINVMDSDESEVSVAPSSVKSPPNSLINVIDSDESAKSHVSVAPSSVMSVPNSLINVIDSDESEVSVAPSSVVSPSNSLMNDTASDESMKSQVSVAPSSVISPPNSLMNDVDSDESVKSQVSVAPSSVMSPPNSLRNDIDSDESVKSQVSVAPSSVMSPPNSLRNDSDSDESVKSQVSVAPSSVMSPPNSLMNDIDSDESVKSQVSVAPSLVMSPPNSLMNDIDSDESAKSQVSVAPSSVMSAPNSLMNDIDSDESAKSQVSVAPSSVMSPPNSLINDIESDESVKSQVSVAPSSVMSPPNSLMNDIDSDESVKSQVSVAPSSVMSPPNSLMNDIDSDESMKSQASVAPSCVSNPPGSLMDDIEDEGSVQSPLSVAPSVAASPPDSLMSDIE